MAGSAGGAPCRGKGSHPGTRRARRQAPQAANGRDRQGLRLRRPRRQGEPARPLRGTQAAARLPLYVRAEPGRGLRRLLDVRRPDRPPRPPARARHVLRARLPGADRQARGLQDANGLDDPVVLSFESDFNVDFDVGPETPQEGVYQDGESFGLSVFIRDGDDVFRTYFTTHRGVEALGSVWTFLDLTPLGRQEEWEDSPEGYPQTKPYEWWRRHDEY